MSVSGLARSLLGAVRIANGTLALVTPATLSRRLNVDPDENPAMLYALRMFGVRTIVLGHDLLRRDERAVRAALLIHASDTLAAAGLTATGKVPRRTGVMITGISALNTVLALAARRGSR